MLCTNIRNCIYFRVTNTSCFKLMCERNKMIYPYVYLNKIFQHKEHIY